ncbi:iron complex outermembrane receptor protein [Halomonas ventosae]|uniref:Iron complex outermembrane receptor protein n=1 Tax=Halomonas ventosae TaxID=229007 RepID=A0A4R6ZFG9_9GAMM|nr:TonB-dependent receptor [Halomonas ventosae]TDR50888.1 iron complex outermembrane receptor protein [Halomonas ventosae]
MTTPILRRLPLVAFIATAWAGAAQAETQTLATMIIEGSAGVPGELSLSPQQSPAPAADAGDWLRRINGIEAVRMGGHGLDPVIRGQQGNALNILVDGGYVFGGCPNRMDPPTAYAPLHSFDRVTVNKGVTTLQHGAGGSGGTVLFERTTPDFDGRDVQQQGSVGASYDDNGERAGLYANLVAGNENGYWRLFGERQEANDYEDGDGRRIHSGFETTSGGLTLGVTPTVDTELAFGWEGVRERDVKFAGAGMDSPESDNDTLRARLDHAFSDTLRMENRLQFTTIDHVMDNYSLRDAPMMKMRSPTESDTLTWKSMAVQQLADSDLRFGVNVLQNMRDARIINDTADKVAFLSWPDVTTRQSGVFADLDHYLGERTTLSGGLRLDYSEASADAADQASDTGVVAADLYRREYGVAGDLDHEAWLVGGFLRGEQRLNDADTLYASLSRAERDADATERYFAKGDWVGNPGLDPEVHHQLDVGIERRLANAGVEVAAYADRVDDYIFRDTRDGVSVYRNIDATLYGVELSGDLQWAHHWEARGQLSWVRGDNLDDGGALADIAPLRGQLSQFHVREAWEAGLTARFSDAQDRLGPDEVATAGYVVLDAEAAWRWQAMTLRAGVSNLLDKTYSDFLNRNRSASDPFLAEDPESLDLPLNEPGRSFWVGVDYTF